MTAKDHARIASQIEELADLTVSQLQQKWVEVWKEPCRSRNKDFLRKRIAWKIQANIYGGISQRALDRARELTDETLLKIRNPPQLIPNRGPTVQGPFVPSQGTRVLMPGTIITREYKGQKLIVMVLDDGFEFKGKKYKSLSAVAKLVTGSHWNGVNFFGLRSQPKAEA